MRFIAIILAFFIAFAIWTWAIPPAWKGQPMPIQPPITQPVVPGPGAPVAPNPVPPPPVSTGQAATGFCTWGGTQNQMQFDPISDRLYMDRDFLSAARAVNASQAITCEMTAHADGVINIIGGQKRIKAGDKFGYNFPAKDSSFGFDYFKSK